MSVTDEGTPRHKSDLPLLLWVSFKLVLLLLLLDATETVVLYQNY